MCIAYANSTFHVADELANEAHDVAVWTSGTQLAEGSIDVVGRIEKPHIFVQVDGPITAERARELPALLIEAADELDGWSAR